MTRSAPAESRGERDPPGNIRSSTPDPETRRTEGDVVVLRGSQEDLEVADMYLMQR